MDVASLAALMAGLQRAQTASALAAEMARRAHAQDEMAVGLIEAAADAGKKTMAEVAASAGIVDITA
jgi:hypothetical protein